MLRRTGWAEQPLPCPPRLPSGCCAQGPAAPWAHASPAVTAAHLAPSPACSHVCCGPEALSKQTLCCGGPEPFPPCHCRAAPLAARHICSPLCCTHTSTCSAGSPVAGPEAGRASGGASLHGRAGAPCARAGWGQPERRPGLVQDREAAAWAVSQGGGAATHGANPPCWRLGTLPGDQGLGTCLHRPLVLPSKLWGLVGPSPASSQASMEPLGLCHHDRDSTSATRHPTELAAP